MSDEISPAFSEFSVGSQIAGYRLEEQIGRGGMAVVYRAYDARLDRRVALKILAPGLALDDSFRHRFIRESRAAAAVDHPNIIPVFDAGEANGVLYIAMRFVQGRDVGTLIDRTGPLPPARATDIIAQVASALDAAHARGLVHRDVKPANMLLDDSAGEDRQDHVYLSDFGLSKKSLSQTGLTSQGQVLGTLDYIAPEQIEGRAVDGRTDLYSLACAAFELLSGAPPFKRGGGLAVAWAQLSEPPPPLTARRAGLPSAVDHVLARAMAKSPDDRYRRCGEFAAALRQALGLRPGERGRKGEGEPPAPATQIAAVRADLPSGPAGDAPWAGEAAPAGAAAPSAGASAPTDTAASADASASAHAAAPAEDALSAGSAAPAGYPGPSYEAGLYADRSYDAEPPTEAAGSVPTIGATRPGLTEPGGPPSWPRGYQLGRPRRPGRRSRGLLSAAAVVVALGIAAGIFAVVHGGGRGGGATLTIPGPTRATVTAPRLGHVRTNEVALGSLVHPFGVAVTPDGRFSFVTLGDFVSVLDNHGGSLAPTQVATIPAPGARKSEAITIDGRYLLAAEGSGAYVISVKKAEADAGRGAVLGTITSPNGSQSVEVSISPDDRYAFITLQNSADMAVFDLQKAFAHGFGQSGFVGFVPNLPSPVGIAQSPDGRWLYVTSEIQAGRLYMISTHLAETNPGRAVQGSVLVGAGPARVLVSPDGGVVWVTDRDSNALVALAADKLLRDPSHSIIARVSVGENPIGLAFVKDGKEIVVADANLIFVHGADNLAVIDTHKALRQAGGALLGFIPTGVTPRELAVEPGGRTLLATDNYSGQLQAVDVASLP